MKRPGKPKAAEPFSGVLPDAWCIWHCVASSRFDRGDAFSLHVNKNLAGLRRVDGAGALDALEHDPVQSSSELNVALAYRATAGENRSFRHILCLRILGLLLDW